MELNRRKQGYWRKNKGQAFHHQTVCIQKKAANTLGASFFFHGFYSIQWISIWDREIYAVPFGKTKFATTWVPGKPPKMLHISSVNHVLAPNKLNLARLSRVRFDNFSQQKRSNSRGSQGDAPRPAKAWRGSAVPPCDLGIWRAALG